LAAGGFSRVHSRIQLRLVGHLNRRLEQKGISGSNSTWKSHPPAEARACWASRSAHYARLAAGSRLSVAHRRACFSAGARLRRPCRARRAHWYNSSPSSLGSRVGARACVPSGSRSRAGRVQIPRSARRAAPSSISGRTTTHPGRLRRNRCRHGGFPGLPQNAAVDSRRLRGLRR
jgi:hypothetical protein